MHHAKNDSESSIEWKVSLDKLRKEKTSGKIVASNENCNNIGERSKSTKPRKHGEPLQPAWKPAGSAKIPANKMAHPEKRTTSSKNKENDSARESRGRKGSGNFVAGLPGAEEKGNLKNVTPNSTTRAKTPSSRSDRSDITISDGEDPLNSFNDRRSFLSRGKSLASKSASECNSNVEVHFDRVAASKVKRTKVVQILESIIKRPLKISEEEAGGNLIINKVESGGKLFPSGSVNISPPGSVNSRKEMDFEETSSLRGSVSRSTADAGKNLSLDQIVSDTTSKIASMVSEECNAEFSSSCSIGEAGSNKCCQASLTSTSNSENSSKSTSIKSEEQGKLENSVSTSRKKCPNRHAKSLQLLREILGDDPSASLDRKKLGVRFKLPVELSKNFARLGSDKGFSTAVEMEKEKGDSSSRKNSKTSVDDSMVSILSSEKDLGFFSARETKLSGDSPDLGSRSLKEKLTKDASTSCSIPSILDFRPSNDKVGSESLERKIIQEATFRRDASISCVPDLIHSTTSGTIAKEFYQERSIQTSLKAVDVSIETEEISREKIMTSKRVTANLMPLRHKKNTCTESYCQYDATMIKLPFNTNTIKVAMTQTEHCPKKSVEISTDQDLPKMLKETGIKNETCEDTPNILENDSLNEISSSSLISSDARQDRCTESCTLQRINHLGQLPKDIVIALERTSEHAQNLHKTISLYRRNFIDQRTVQDPRIQTLGRRNPGTETKSLSELAEKLEPRKSELEVPKMKDDQEQRSWKNGKDSSEVFEDDDDVYGYQGVLSISRKNVLALVYGFTCTLVFFCLRFSIACES
ncbi:uncharacterized protein LOC105700477 [Orussus abietinus]|uniref:uncharacterized protein LOC105700477 n=1 Tax=Orussus abietinus TaxID=222816 RepID=UPI000626B73F|nr:uncharacterized protein LOC105700477 [Orussus abietinus]XP_012281739.1 uncharacterized protein LOC105700477 [Orussus abietinus]